jgi:hypothetical protein
MHIKMHPIEIFDLEKVYWYRSFLGGKNTLKKMADLHPRQCNLHLQLFSGQQNLSSLHKIGWRSAEKNPFSSSLVLA